MSYRTKLHDGLSAANRTITKWGFDRRKALERARGLRWVSVDRDEYNRQRLASGRPDEFPPGVAREIFRDRSDPAGIASGHYFHQDLLVAREIFVREPRRHIDVGSRLDGFVAHVATFRDIEVLDLRPLSPSVPGITFFQHDVMALDASFRGVADSVSCLHALEHFGLGRYGDAVDYDGWRKGLDGLAEMLEPGGTLYLGVPTGEPQRVEFNAHRVFSLPFLRAVLEARFDVERLDFVTDAGDLVTGVDPYGSAADRSFGVTYGCSIWILRKR